MKNVHLSKPKIMKLACIGKEVDNIHGTIIHLTFTIPLNKKMMNIKDHEKWDILIKTYDQLWVVFHEISLVGVHYCKLHVIKQAHTKFMGGFDVQMTCDFYNNP